MISDFRSRFAQTKRQKRQFNRDILAAFKTLKSMDAGKEKLRKGLYRKPGKVTGKIEQARVERVVEALMGAGVIESHGTYYALK